MKDEVREAFPDMAARRAFLREAAMGSAAEAAMAGDTDKATAILRAAMAAPDKRQGRIFLLDGSGPADLLSLRALRALAEADAIMADARCDPLVLARARRDATRLAVDDQALAASAAAGLKVVRITAGPPYALIGALTGAVVLPVARP
jgi:precorrin-2 dehydrogenase/sirohydrochlorin ferrochelatase